MHKPKVPIPDNPVLAEQPVWADLFGRPTQELHLEIGSGHGGFALAFAAAHPEVDFVAMEWRKKFADWTRARAVQRGLRNLLVLQADARLEVQRLFGESSLDCIHLQFPDPWWKRRHHKRRVVDEGFAPFLRSRLRPGGLLEVRTDVQERGEEMRALLEAAGFHNEAGAGNFSPRPDDEIPSTREKRYLATGEPVFRLRMRRPA
jgi:tRNA (guanine-N7-)-methyltransferase